MIFWTRTVRIDTGGAETGAAAVEYCQKRLRGRAPRPGVGEWI